jgi:DNA ligase (NAD+)
VIPEIVRVIEDKRLPSSTPFSIPLKCPQCESPAQKLEGEVILRCVNPLCPARLKESLKHFVSRRAMNIERLGDKVVEALVDRGLVRCFSDIYLLSTEKIESIERQGKKSAKNIFDSIQQSKQTTLARLIFALGIRFVGEQTAKTLALNYGSMKSFLAANEEDLVTIEGIGPKVAQSITSSTRNMQFIEEIQKLQDAGVVAKGDPLSTKSTPILGKKFVITGTLPISRDDAKSIIETNGGLTLSAISKKVDFVIAGTEAGSKLEKAINLGLPVISWEEVQSMLTRP